LKKKVQHGVNIFSLLASILSVILLIILVLFRYRFANRVTLRLQAFIALIDIFKHANLLGQYSPSGSLCVAVGFFEFFTTHLYVFSKCNDCTQHSTFIHS